MNKQIDIEEIKQKFYQRLIPSGWAYKLKGFILSEDFTKILEFLVNESLQKRKFTPKLKQLFRAFEECPYDKLKIVIVGQDPYPHIYKDEITAADGIAFSCANYKKKEKSLVFMTDEIKRTVEQEKYNVDALDLKVWSNQGVLMLNSALTVQLNNPETHVEIWKPFMQYLLDVIKTEKPDIIYAFLGKKAQAYKLNVGSSKSYSVMHPASAAHNSRNIWDSKGIFKNMNDDLISLGKDPVIW